MSYTVDRRPGAGQDPSGLMLYKAGWKDLTGSFSTGKVAGSNVPAWVQIRDGLYAYSFTADALKEIWLAFHINHDYAPGTDFYPHIHFVPLTNEVQGVVRWGIEYMYADRDTGTFPSSTTVYVETTVAANSQYKHLVTEVTDAQAIKGAGDRLTVDGVFMTRFFRDGAHANDTYAGDVAGIFADMHYQSDRDATLNRVADFYA